MIPDPRLIHYEPVSGHGAACGEAGARPLTGDPRAATCLACRVWAGGWRPLPGEHVEVVDASAWAGKAGAVERVEGERVLVRLLGTDACGHTATWRLWCGVRALRPVGSVG